MATILPMPARPAARAVSKPVPAASALPPRLSVRGAHKAFKTRVVLSAVDLDVRPGEIFGLLGPNGAGKSTLMRAICGRLKLDGGTVQLDGADPATNTAARRHIGFVPQDIALYGYLTVRENLMAFARLAGVPRAMLTETVAKGLARTGLTQRADSRVETLSGGYQRRVNICASVLHQPSVLVLDEPTVGIDVDAREQIHALLNDLRSRGTAIVLTTHELDQAQTLADRVGILQAGQFICEGPPDELIEKAFAGQAELTCLLGSIDDAQAQTLRTLGLSPGQAPGTWTCLAPAAAIDLQLVSRRLQQTGVAVRELRVREPDLSTLFVTALKAGPKS